VLANNPATDSLTIVELNHEYVRMMYNFPEVASVLSEPKVKLAFDDGRRWMVRHPDARFDAIVINGTWHWRSGATHILSREFLEETKRHLNPGGVVFWNTTGSLDVVYTATGVFKHVTRYLNFVAGSDSAFHVDRATRLAALQAFHGTGDSASMIHPFADSGAYVAALPELLDTKTTDVAPQFRRANDLWFITDDNMATEFKTNGAGAWWRALPSRVFRPELAWTRVLF
jgi:SAM-dependent methyltransferase